MHRQRELHSFVYEKNNIYTSYVLMALSIVSNTKYIKGVDME